MEKNNNIPKLYIKDMVCQRCVITVEFILQNAGIPFHKVSLGEVEVARVLSYTEIATLQEELQKVGFDFVESRVKKIIDDIKKALREYLNQSASEAKVNLSTFITDTVPYEYSYLSDLFSSMEGITIEKYFLDQRIEKVKELILYDQLSLTEIAFRTGFSSVHHLSGQFRKLTGYSPSQFKTTGMVNRKFIDKLNSPNII